jgi:hypothetical protein
MSIEVFGMSDLTREGERLLIIPEYRGAYDTIVNPAQVRSIDKGLLRDWVGGLSPTGVLVVNAFRQLSYATCTPDLHDGLVASMAGISVSSWTHRWKAEIAAGKGYWPHFVRVVAPSRMVQGKDGSLRQSATTYAVEMQNPFSPTMVGAIRDMERRGFSSQDIAKLPSSTLLGSKGLLDDEVPALLGQLWPHDRHSEEVLALKARKTLILPQYWFQRWLPELGAGPSWLWMYLRSYAYEDDGGITRVPVFPSATLARIAGVTHRTVNLWLEKLLQYHTDGPVNQLVTKDDDGYYKFPINLPLHPEDAKLWYEMIGQGTVAVTPILPIPTPPIPQPVPQPVPAPPTVSAPTEAEAITPIVAPVKASPSRTHLEALVSLALPGREPDFWRSQRTVLFAQHLEAEMGEKEGKEWLRKWRRWVIGESRVVTSPFKGKESELNAAMTEMQSWQWGEWRALILFQRRVEKEGNALKDATIGLPPALRPHYFAFRICPFVLDADGRNATTTISFPLDLGKPNAILVTEDEWRKIQPLWMPS